MKESILRGIRVVELGAYLSAPIAGMLLAEQGADVIRIKNPNFKPYDPVLEAMLERNKIIIPLNLKDDNARTKLIDLLSHADIVIENLGYEVLKNLGIDLEKIRKTLNPALIVCRIPGFPENDRRKNVKSFEAVVGMAGLMYERPLKKPMLHPFPIGSVLAAIYSATSAVALLINRVNSGKGDISEVSMLGADLFSQVLQILVLTGAPRQFMPLKMVGTPFMGPWECSDKRWVYVHITMPSHNRIILEEFIKLGLGEYVEKLKKVMSPTTFQDPSLVDSIAEAKAIREILKEIYRQKPADEWEKLLGDNLCVAKIRTVDEWVHDSYEAKMPDNDKVEDPIFGEMFVCGKAVTSTEFETSVVPRTFDESLEKYIERWNNQSVFCDPNRYDEYLKKPEEQLKQLFKLPNKNAPLAGIRVLDLSRIIAGPFSTRILAELGADVLAIQSPTSLDWALSFHVIFNCGKRSVTLDLNKPEDKKRFWKILESFKPHVIALNYRNLELTKEIGIDFEEIKKRLPNVVYTYMNAYGIEGGWQHRPAFEQIIQAVTGIQIEYVKTGRPKIVPIPILDMGSGLIGAFASVLGIYGALKSKKAVFMHTHMTMTATFLQIMRIAKNQRDMCFKQAAQRGYQIGLNYDEKVVAGLLNIQDYRIVVAGRWKDMREWIKKYNLAPIGQRFEDSLLKLQSRLRFRFLGYVKRTIRKGGFENKIGVMRRYKVANVLADIERNQKGRIPLVSRKKFPGLTKMTVLRSPFYFKEHDIVDVNPAPIRGQDTKEVLELLDEKVPDKYGLIPYPSEKPFFMWVFNLVEWGIYTLRSGNF